MNSIPVDMSRLTGMVCVAAPEARTTPDGVTRTDRDGNTLYVIGVALRRAGTRKASVIDVQTAVEPVGVAEGTPVRLVDLDVALWEIDGRHGLSYKAALIAPATPTTITAPPGRGKADT
jgi:hypothetical protein